MGFTVGLKYECSLTIHMHTLTDTWITDPNARGLNLDFEADIRRNNGVGQKTLETAKDPIVSPEALPSVSPLFV